MTKKHSIMGNSISTFEGLVSDGNNFYYDFCDSNDTGVVTPQDTWWMQVIHNDNGEFLANASWSGSMVEGEGFPAGQSLERAKQLLGKNGEIPDVVWVFFGINDYGWGGYQAQLHGHANNAPANINLQDYEFKEPGNAPVKAADLFEQAYTTMLNNIKNVAPQSEIRCLTLIPGRLNQKLSNTFCYHLRGIPLQQYNDAIKRAAAKIDNAQVLDIYALGYDYATTDGTHPNKDGMIQIATLATTSLKQDTHILKDYPEYLKSNNPCNKSTCVGCRFAEGTGIAWSCVCNCEF